MTCTLGWSKMIAYIVMVFGSLQPFPPREISSSRFERGRGEERHQGIWGKTLWSRIPKLTRWLWEWLDKGVSQRRMDCAQIGIGSSKQIYIIHVRRIAWTRYQRMIYWSHLLQWGAYLGGASLLIRTPIDEVLQRSWQLYLWYSGASISYSCGHDPCGALVPLHPQRREVHTIATHTIYRYLIDKSNATMI